MKFIIKFCVMKAVCVVWLLQFCCFCVFSFLQYSSQLILTSFLLLFTSRIHFHILSQPIMSSFMASILFSIFLIKKGQNILTFVLPWRTFLTDIIRFVHSFRCFFFSLRRFCNSFLLNLIAKKSILF